MGIVTIIDLKDMECAIVLEQAKMDRINELAKKKKEIGLTEAEAAEQKVLREEYLVAFRKSFKQQLDGIKIVREE